MPGVIRLESITIYPIKSARGIDLPTAEVTPRGLAWDRRWMVVDGQGRFMSQRHYPRMALIGVAMEDQRLEVTAPGMPPLQLPIDRQRGQREVVVWSDRCDAVSLGSEAADWFGAFLGVACEPVFMPETTRRAVDPTYAVEGDIVSFADGFPVLLIGRASLEDLNGRLSQPLSMRRFRPNLVVAGSGAFAEDGWRRITVGRVGFRVVKPCGRCRVTTVDPDTGRVGREPLATLATYRRREGRALFGQNLIPDGVGQIRVSDTIEVVDTPEDDA